MESSGQSTYDEITEANIIIQLNTNDDEKITQVKVSPISQSPINEVMFAVICGVTFMGVLIFQAGRILVFGCALIWANFKGSEEVSGVNSTVESGGGVHVSDWAAGDGGFR